MRKLIVTCQCGQRMQVPRSAVGKTGLCPTCGQIVTISNDNATATPSPKGNRPLHARQVWWEGRNTPPEDAKRKFGEAVDLYYAARYGEALAIFDALAKQFPGNPDIENGRTQCMTALRRTPGALEDMSGGASAAAPKEERQGAFDEETVRRVVLEKMLYGSTETVQLQAAELAARLLGMFDRSGRKPEQPPAESGLETQPEVPEAEEEVSEVAMAAEEPQDEEPEAETEPPVAEEQLLRRSRIPIPSESDLERDRKRAIGL
jgi:hypothetical protein